MHKIIVDYKDKHNKNSKTSVVYVAGLAGTVEGTDEIFVAALVALQYNQLILLTYFPTEIHLQTHIYTLLLYIKKIIKKKKIYASKSKRERHPA